MFRILAEHEWAVIFRLGRVARVTRPGMMCWIPVIDRVVVVDLNRTLPGWRGIPKSQIEKLVKFIVLHYPEIPVGLSESELLEEMERTRQKDEQRRIAVELARTGQMDRAIDVLTAIEPGLSKDVAELHLRYLVLWPENRDIKAGMYLLEIEDQEKEALPLLCRGLNCDEDRVRLWLEFIHRGLPNRKKR